MEKQVTSKATVFINREFEDIRADRFLAKKINVPYSMLFRFFRQGKVKVNNVKAKHNQILMFDDEVKCFFNTNFEETSKTSPENNKSQLERYKHILFDNVLHSNKDYLVINKPANIATQGGTGIKLSIDDLLKFCKEPTFLAHRIDKKTSGILVTAKNHKALTYLTSAFKEGSVNKTYLAIVQGKLASKQGTINKPLIKSNNSKRQLVIIDEKRGKKAVTDYKILASSKRGNFHLLELKPHTGRTHQIRVHLAKVLNAPIVGDFKYGYEDKSLLFKDHKNIFKKDDLFLHAYKIDFTNYDDDFLSFLAPLSSSWQKAIDFFEIKGDF